MHYLTQVGRQIRIISILIVAVLLCPLEFANSQVTPNGVTGIITNILLADCPIITEPRLKICTPPVLETQAHINAFADVEIVKGHLQIEAQTQLDLSPLNKLREIYGILYLQNTGLTTINGFNNLEHVGARAVDFGYGDEIYIDNNPNLTSISGFQKLRKPTHPQSRSPSIFIRFNPLLSQISGFSQLDQAAVVSIRFNSQLNSISGFNSLHTIDSGIGLTITDSPSLSSVPSFANLATINGGLELYNLPSLSSLPSFQNLAVVRDMRVHNTGITELASFKNAGLQNISSISITDNPNLTLISGLTNLRSIAGERGDFYISDNPNLDNVTGLNSLITNDPTDYISVSDNPKLNCPQELFMLEPVAYSQSNLVNCQTTPYSF